MVAITIVDRVASLLLIAQTVQFNQYSMPVILVSGRSKNFERGGGRKTIYQLRPRLSQMRTTKYMPFTRKKRLFEKKYEPTGAAALTAPPFESATDTCEDKQAEDVSYISLNTVVKSHVSTSTQPFISSRNVMMRFGSLVKSHTCAQRLIVSTDTTWICTRIRQQLNKKHFNYLAPVTKNGLHTKTCLAWLLLVRSWMILENCVNFIIVFQDFFS